MYVIVWLKFEPAYNDVAVQHISYTNLTLNFEKRKKLDNSRNYNQKLIYKMRSIMFNKTCLSNNLLPNYTIYIYIYIYIYVYIYIYIYYSKEIPRYKCKIITRIKTRSK